MPYLMQHHKPKEGEISAEDILLVVTVETAGSLVKSSLSRELRRFMVSGLSVIPKITYWDVRRHITPNLYLKLMCVHKRTSHC